MWANCPSGAIPAAPPPSEHRSGQPAAPGQVQLLHEHQPAAADPLDDDIALVGAEALDAEPDRAVGEPLRLRQRAAQPVRVERQVIGPDAEIYPGHAPAGEVHGRPLARRRRRLWWCSSWSGCVWRRRSRRKRGPARRRTEKPKCDHRGRRYAARRLRVLGGRPRKYARIRGILAALRFVLGSSRSAAMHRILRPRAASTSDTSRCERTYEDDHL